MSYANGMFMTAGQHKGIMLLTLLNDATRDIKAVVYVDDNVRHVGMCSRRPWIATSTSRRFITSAKTCACSGFNTATSATWTAAGKAQSRAGRRCCE